ncbi:MAG: BspA family leucine-rich repeat surface protein [Bacteroidales bacterium]|nr:BspA family leucine-rich repeat surface protein [Bacteroidales bacterium]
MKKYFIALACLAAAAMVSCTRDFNPESVSAGKVLTLSLTREVPGQDTKAALDGTSVVFQADDAVSVMSGSENARFTTVSGGAPASFSGTASDAEQYVVLSPYNAEAALQSASVVRITIPEVQNAVPGGVDPKALISAGIALKGASSVKLFNAVSLVKVEVPGGLTVKEIQVAGGFGQNIAIGGQFDFNAQEESLALSVVANKTSTVVTLVPAEGESIIAPGTYYVAVRPKTTYDGGFTVAYVDGDNQLCKRATRTAADIQRSHIFPVGTLNTTDYAAVTGRATLRYADSAPQFTGLIKQLAGGSGAVLDKDYTIRKIVFRAHSLYSQAYKAGGNLISNGPNSDVQIHAWVIDDTAYVYTEAPIITLYSASGNLFRDFEALEEVSFNDVNTMAGASFEYMFRNCTNLKSVDFGNADFSNVTTYGWMFANAQKLERVSFGETATTSATSMQSMFSQVFNLRYLYLGKNFTLPANVTNMFNGTASVTTTVQDEEGHGLQCKLHASQALWDTLNTDLNGDGVNTTTGFNKNRFYFTPVD